MGMSIRRIALLSALFLLSFGVGIDATSKVEKSTTKQVAAVSEGNISNKLSNIGFLDFKSSNENISKLFNIVLEKYFDFSIELKGDPYTVFDDDWSLFRKVRNVMLSKLVESGVNIKILQDSETGKCIFAMVQPKELDLVPGVQGFFNAVFHYDPDTMPEFKEGVDKTYDLILKTHSDIPVLIVSSLDDSYLNQLVSLDYAKQFIKTNAIELNPTEFI